MEARGSGAGADGEDRRLMVAYASGNARAFDELYARHKGGTYRYFLRHVGGQRATAEELHQDLWLKVIGARNRYAATARFATWLYTLARHRLVDHWRSRQDARWVSLAEDIEPEAAPGAAEALMQAEGCDPLRAAMDAQSSRQLLSALEAVSTLQRDAFLLHIEGGLPLEEIARLTGASMETVKSRLRYAYRKLRSALGEMQ